jgi:hypothetical protein
MNGAEPQETMKPTEAGGYFNWRAWILWPVVIALVYFLSCGPVLMFLNKREAKGLPDPRIVDAIYVPWFWAYLHTPLHKPLGIYMHLWDPAEFDKKGDPRWYSKSTAGAKIRLLTSAATNPRLTGEG